MVAMDGKWLVSQANPSAREPLQDLTPFGPVPDQAPAVVAVDAAGERLAFVRVTVDAAGERPVFHNDGGIILRRRDKQTGKIIEETLPSAGDTRASQTINALAFSPDGRRLAAGTQDNSVVLWDTDGKNGPRHLTGHLCFVSCVAFSPDGKRLVSGSEDWTVKIWDIEVGRATLTLSGHKGRIRDLAFSPDGKYLASASEDATVRIWPGVLEAAEDRWEQRALPANLPTLIKRGNK